MKGSRALGFWCPALCRWGGGVKGSGIQGYRVLAPCPHCRWGGGCIQNPLNRGTVHFCMWAWSSPMCLHSHSL